MYMYTRTYSSFLSMGIDAEELIRKDVANLSVSCRKLFLFSKKQIVMG